MKEAIRQVALELGFDDCRFTTAEPPERGARGWPHEGGGLVNEGREAPGAKG